MSSPSPVLPAFLLALVLLPACSAPPDAPETTAAIETGFVYPEAAISEVTDVYHGTSVPDPYRWLEDPDSPETRAWVEAQCALTFPFLKSLPGREAIEQRLTELWNYEKQGVPFKRGTRYFYTRNNGLQNQDVLYVTDDPGQTGTILLDPNTLSEDGTVALSAYTVSRDGRWLAYGLSSGGSDWTEWRVREVATGKDLADHLKWIKFSFPAWDGENEGFYYTRYAAPKSGQELEQANYFQKVCYHKLKTGQSEDRLVYERPDHKDWIFEPDVSDDGAYLVITARKGTERKQRAFYRREGDLSGEFIPLQDAFEGRFVFVDNDGPLFWFFTDIDAPRGRLVEVDIRTPDRAQWKPLIRESEDVLQSVNVINDTFTAVYLDDAHARVRLVDRKGTFLREVELPGLGTVTGFGGRRDETETFFRFTGFADPGSIFRFDLASGKVSLYKRPDLRFDPEDFTTTQVFYQSADGTRIPMFLSHKKGLEKTGELPVLLYGYGGFNASLTPHFRVSKLLWMELGGVYAVANLRGGGEYGRAWHEAGMKRTKQNTFDDFIAAAEWLTDRGYTRPDRLAIEGASNGGLLVGASMTQRPELFGACLPAVGVMDMLRFNKFTIGWAWESDYGSPQDPEDFEVLYGYSPYHNIRPGTSYPPTLVTTADHDDRVVPAHSFKFAARLQAAQGGDAPVLIRIETRAGHGAGKPTAKRIEEAVDVTQFLRYALNLN